MSKFFKTLPIDSKVGYEFQIIDKTRYKFKLNLNSLPIFNEKYFLKKHRNKSISEPWGMQTSRFEEAYDSYSQVVRPHLKL